MAEQHQTSSRPPWLAPLVIVLLVAALVGVGHKRRDAVENPLVDLMIITVGVFAFAAGFRYIAGKLSAPGLALFFGAQPTATTAV